MLFFLSVMLLLSSTSASQSPSSPKVRRNTALASRDKYYGHGTWYIPGLGACGSQATGTDFIVALNQQQYHGKMCYKHIHIINTLNGKSVHAQIQDKCPGCTYGSLDMSPVVFAALAESGLGEGKIDISWSFSGSSSHSHSHAHPHPHPHSHSDSHKHKHQHRHSHNPQVPAPLGQLDAPLVNINITSTNPGFLGGLI